MSRLESLLCKIEGNNVYIINNNIIRSFKTIVYKV